MALYGLGNSAQADQEADSYRQGATGLSHGFHMPGVVIAGIPPDPIKEFDRELAEFRVLKTNPSPTVFLKLVEQQEMLSFFKGDQLEALLSRGEDAKAKTSEDFLAHAEFLKLAFQKRAQTEPSDLIAKRDESTLAAITADITQAKSLGADTGRASEQLAVARKSLDATVEQLKQRRANTKDLLKQAIEEEKEWLAIEQPRQAVRVWDRAIRESGNASEVLVAHFFSETFRSTTKPEERTAEAKRLAALIPEDSPARKEIDDWLEDEPIRTARFETEKLIRQGDNAAAPAILDALVARFPDLPKAYSERLTSVPYRVLKKDSYRKDIKKFVDVAVTTTKDAPDPMVALWGVLDPVEDHFMRHDQSPVVSLLWNELYARLPDSLPVRLPALLFALLRGVGWSPESHR